MWCPHVQSFDGVADGDVAVHTHHGESEGAGEHVVVVNGDDHFAQDIPKGPEAQKDICSLEWQCGKDERISQSQVEDVYIGGRLHFCVPETKYNNNKFMLK